MAGGFTFGSRTIDMRAGSKFLAELDEALPSAEYDMYSYARLGDWIVGVENTAPPGRTAWWALSSYLFEYPGPLQGPIRR